MTPFIFCVQLPFTLLWVLCQKCIGLCWKTKRATTSKNDENIRTVAPTEIKNKADRNWDLAIFGVTGFTGKIAAKYLAKNYASQKGFKWVIVGRSRSKLDEVKKELVLINKDAENVDVRVADSTNFDSLAEICHDARVVVTTVGPYDLHGHTLVNVCALYGTDYADITGECKWVREMCEKFSEMARKSGCRLLNCCGHDCVPWDLSVLFMAKKLKNDHNEDLKKVDFWTNNAFIGLDVISGGTIATLFESFDITKRRYKPSMAPRTENIYYRQPGNSAPGSGYRGRSNNQRVLQYESLVGNWVGVFLMADVNYHVVDRSAALFAYGDGITYSDRVLFPNFMAGYMFYIGLISIGMSMACPPFRWLLRTFVLPKQGQGPSDWTLENNFLNLFGQGTGANGTKVNCVMSCKGDAGYRETATMLVEAGLTMSFNDGNVKNLCGGSWTSAALGEDYMNRLRKANFDFHFYNPRAESVEETLGDKKVSETDALLK